jgi:hypothetical protein
MNAQLSMGRLLGSSLLGVLAAAALTVAGLMVVGAWSVGSRHAGWAMDAGSSAMLIIAVLALAYAVVAGYAAREVWRARPAGRVLGLTVALVAILAAGATLLVGNATTQTTLLLYLAIGLGLATAIPLLIPDQATRG